MFPPSNQSSNKIYPNQGTFESEKEKLLKIKPAKQVLKTNKHTKTRTYVTLLTTIILGKKENLLTDIRGGKLHL